MEDTIKKTRLMLFVDMQNDFMDKKHGLLYVDGAEDIRPTIEKLRNKVYADDTIFTDVLYTSDYHEHTDKELSNEPDFVTTFPPHCMKDSWGSELIDEVKTKSHEALRPTVFLKNEFSVFEGSPLFEDFLKELEYINEIYIAGVSGDVCVYHAIEGLLAMKKSREFKFDTLYIVKDAIASLNPENFTNYTTTIMESLDFVKLITVDEI